MNYAFWNHRARLDIAENSLLDKTDFSNWNMITRYVPANWKQKKEIERAPVFLKDPERNKGGWALLKLRGQISPPTQKDFCPGIIR